MGELQGTSEEVGGVRGFNTNQASKVMDFVNGCGRGGALDMIYWPAVQVRRRNRTH
jgi:hypothetical protein